MTRKKHPRIAVALGGGGAWCISQIGVLRAFEEAGINIYAVAGTSGGSIIGALYADGHSLDELTDIAASAGLTDFIRPTVPKTGFFDSNGIANFMKKNLRHKKIQDMPIRFAAIAADLESGEKVTITEGDAPAAVRASCSIPVIFTPTVLGGRTLVDGGVVSAVPVMSARESFNADIVVGVNVNYKINETSKLNNIQGIAYHLTLMLIKANTKLEMPRADVLINVHTDGIGPHEVRKHKELIERGYAVGRQAADELLAMI